MTLILTFPIKNAWVCVADRLIIHRNEAITNEGRQEINRIDNLTKLEKLSNNYIFAGAGNKTILEIVANTFERRNNFVQFIEEIRSFANRLYETNGRLETEFLLINQENLKATKIDLDQVRINRRSSQNGVYDLTSCENGFLGGIEVPHLDNAKAKLLRRENYTFKSKLYRPLIEQCIGILEDISKERLDCIGHPAVDGCDIWIVSKRKIMKFFVYPKNYEIKRLND